MAGRKRRQKRSGQVAKTDEPSPLRAPDSSDNQPRSAADADADAVAAEQRTVVTRRSQSYQGPLPPPQMMAGYEEVLPGLADRIMAMAEETSAHIRKVRERGQWFSLWISTLVIVVGAWRGNAEVSIQALYLLAAIYVFSRLPDWWHSWKRPPDEAPPGSDEEE